jgi:hypothetical protein
MMRLAAGLPAVTTKKLAFKSVVGELCFPARLAQRRRLPRAGLQSMGSERQ